MYIDFHTHCFPDRIADRAIAQISHAAGGAYFYSDGTKDGLLASMRRSHIDRSVVLNIATNAHQQASVNRFAAELNALPSLIAFGSVYPDAPDALEELDRIAALRLKGVKFHPDYQHFFVDEPRMKPIYRKISSLGLITVFHAGLDYGCDYPFHCMPENLRRALAWFDTPVVAAHWGGFGCGTEVLEKLCGENLYFDTSFGYMQMPRSVACRIVGAHGTDRLLLGTDSPWHTIDMELRLLQSIGLNSEEMERICHRNAERLLGIGCADA